MLIPPNSLVSAQTSSDPAILQADSQTNQDKASNLDEETPVKSDFVERATENLAPGTVLKLPATVAPKFSLEISDFVEVNRSPAESEAFDSNRSTSEIAETESDISYNAYEILHAEEMTVSSSTHPAEGPFSEGGRGHSFTEYEGEEGFEIHETLRRDDENFNDLGQEIEERSESYATDRAHSERRPRQEMLNFPWSKLFTFAMGVLAAALMLSDRKVSKNVPTMKHPGECDGYITWKMDNVTDLVARAQFNKRDLRLSEFITVRNYEVRLGVGSTFSVDENVVILWITAVVMKDDERPWPFEESMQLRLEHENPNLVESYNFTSDQKGQWREKRRNERKSLIFRQMQVETTKRLKYMRFSYYLTYDDAVAKGYIKSDSISVGFKLMPWGPSA